MTYRSIRHRLFCQDDLVAEGEVTLDAKATHYLANVLRLKAGDGVRLFNGRDGEWETAIAHLSKKSLTLSITRQLRPQVPEPGPVLMFAPIKKARLDFLVEKAVELGASALVPVITQYTQHGKLNMERLRAQVIEAAEQCERLTLPDVLGPKPLLQALMDTKETVLFADEKGGGMPLSKVETDGKSIAFLVGPEGGFSPDERTRILELDQSLAVDLGPRILRAETAALAGLAALALNGL